MRKRESNRHAVRQIDIGERGKKKERENEKDKKRKNSILKTDL